MSTEPSQPQYVIRVHKALADPRALDFFVKTVCESYQEFYGAYRQESEAIIRAAVGLLLDSQSRGPSAARLAETLEVIQRDLTRKDDRTFWFNVVYQHYKITVRPQRDSGRIRGFIRGGAVLDLGCGGGYLALELAKLGHAVTMTDLLDYRVDAARALPFVQMPNPHTLPFAADSYDTIIAKTVLHHVDKEHLPLLLGELSRVAQRVIVLEDTYDVHEEEVENYDAACVSQPNLREYMTLTPNEQRHVLVLLDYFGNAVARGIPTMNFPFEFKPPRTWKAMFEAYGFQLGKCIVDGYEAGKMHKCCQVWMIFDRRQPISTRRT